MSPLYSVVIPTYNRTAVLMRAVRSVYDQSFTDFEVWVVDDGSDGAEEALRPFGERLCYVRGTGRGVAAARNLAIRAVRGDYVAFLDADDWWYSEKLQRMALAVAAHPEVGLFYSRVDAVDPEGRKLWTPEVQDAGVNGYLSLLLQGDYITTSAVVARTEALHLVGAFDEELSGCEDWDLWIRMAQISRLHLVPETLVAYEYLSNNSLTSRKEFWLGAMQEVVDKALARDLGLSQELRRRIRSRTACTRGRIRLGASDDASALDEFRRAVRLDRRNWRAFVYAVVLRSPRLRRVLPRCAKVALRLPEAQP